MKVYQHIINYKRAHDGNSPTLRELGDIMGGKSTSVIDHHLKHLVALGLIRLRNTGAVSRGIEVVGGQWTYKQPADFDKIDPRQMKLPALETVGENGQD